MTAEDVEKESVEAFVAGDLDLRQAWIAEAWDAMAHGGTLTDVEQTINRYLGAIPRGEKQKLGRAFSRHVRDSEGWTIEDVRLLRRLFGKSFALSRLLEA